MSEPPWLDWGKRLQALAQTGLHYASDPFDRERYRNVRDVASELLAHHSSHSAEAIAGLFSAEEGYATPKVDVRAAVFKDEGILLVRERSDGGWTLPGGFADVGQSPRQCIEREVYEESGYRVKVSKLAAVYDRRLHDHPPNVHSFYKFFFLCELKGGEACTSMETDGVSFFRPGELPPLSSERVTERQVLRMFEHRENPELATDCD